MRLEAPGHPHLTYCTNIHPGERWTEIRANLERYVTAVKERVSPHRPFGVGLRLGGQAANDLDDPGALAELRELLRSNDLYVFTVNGFPFGPFHGACVKEAVYRPDWREPERVRYTDRLATILAELLPDDGTEGSVSTVPGAFRPLARTERDREQIARNIAQHVCTLMDIQERTGKTVSLAIEPEPCCMIETTEEAVHFYEEHLLGRGALGVLREAAGLDSGAAEGAMRRHVGVCLDTCHAAVEFEDPSEAVGRITSAGIRIPKVQLSAGLHIPRLDAETVRALEPFDEPVYLHQVVERRGERLSRHLDLADAVQALHDDGFEPPREWRVHFHVPIFLDALADFGNTQWFVDRILALLSTEPFSPHLEVETYTWDVLPECYRGDDVVTAVARELRWVLDRLEP